MIWKGAPLGLENGKPLAYDGNAPLLIFGPPGSYKTVGFICNQLLDDDGSRPRSYIVIDPKGEICAITSRYRRRVSDVKIINPYGVLVERRPDMASDGWNPLGDLDPADTSGLGDHCQAKGDALIKSTGHEMQPHFTDGARSACTGTIKFEVMDAARNRQPPSLANVRRILTQDPKALAGFVKIMMAVGDFDITTRIDKFKSPNTETANIQSTIEVQTSWMSKPLRDDMATAGGVDFVDCTRRSTTVYVIVPTTELISKGVYLRLILSTALRALYRDGGMPTTLLVEEAFVLGHHAEIEQAAAILRGYGSRFTIVFQSLSQAMRHYPDTWGLFTAGAVLGFRPADLPTAEWMTKKAGRIAVPVVAASDPRPGEMRPSINWQQRDRDRIPLGKMFGMPPGWALVWLPNEEVPRKVRVLGYFDIPELNARASPNPYYAAPADDTRRRRR